MRRGWVLVACATVWLATPSAAADRSRWSVTPPPGWNDVTAELADDPGLAFERRKWGPDATVDIAVYATDDRGMQATYVDVEMMADIDWPAFMRGMKKSVAKRGEQVRSFEARAEHDVIVVDSVYESDGALMFGRVLVGYIPPRRMLMLTVVCGGDEATCAPVLASMSFDRAGLHPIPADWNAPTPPTVRDDVDDSTAYKSGTIIGYVLFIGLPIFLVLRWMDRNARRRRPVTPPSIDRTPPPSPLG